MSIDLSIIIVNYNTKDLLIACIDSILRVNPKLEYEIIVVDNASSDGSQDVLAKLVSKKLRLIQHKSNLGFAKANNTGIKKALGKYIFLLNSDTLVKRGTLETLVEFAKKNLSVGLAAPQLFNLDGTVQPSVFRFPTIGRAIRQYWFGEKGILDKHYPSSNKPVLVEAVVAAAFLITPQVLSKVGLLDEKYFMYFEDLDYCKRVNEAGLGVYYLPTSEVIHYHGASGKGSLANKYLISSSKKYFGIFRYYIYTFILWSGQKLKKQF